MKVFLVAAIVCAVAFGIDFTVTVNDPSTLGCDTVDQWSGYISWNNKNLFYWFFASRGNATVDPVILWLTGGPGCSSMLALLAENGPCSVNKDGTLKLNPYSWNAAGSTLYVDQPVGTGFSFGSPMDSNEAQVAEDMYQFLQGFFGKFSQFRNNKFYVTGESYAGHYVPAVSGRIVKGNNAGGGIRINLNGSAIGNGLVDPEIQYNYYADYAYNNGIRRVVSQGTYALMKAATPGCVRDITRCNNGVQADCDIAFARCNAALINPVASTGVNLYDVRIPCAVEPLCYDLSAVDTFLNKASTKTALGVSTSRTWQSCNNAVNGMFHSDWMKDYQMNFPIVLATGAKVLVYAGEDDFICNWFGNKAWATAMDWPGQKAFNATADSTWLVDGAVAGQYRSYQKYSFVKVANAGHMVPMDQPKNALEMIKRFLLA